MQICWLIVLGIPLFGDSENLRYHRGHLLTLGGVLADEDTCKQALSVVQMMKQIAMTSANFGQMHMLLN